MFRFLPISEIRWQAVAQHCTILYGVCDDSNDGKNFRSEYWRKLQPSDFESLQGKYSTGDRPLANDCPVSLKFRNLDSDD